MRLSILIYDGFTTLDAVGGYEVLSRIPGELDAASTWTLGACNDVGILGAAGLLKGKTAATNWFYQERRAAHGATFRPANSLPKQSSSASNTTPRRPSRRKARWRLRRT